jgi:hypothetical protein
MSNTTLPGVREKMTEIAAKAVKDGRIPADTASGGAAGLVPNFSKGTRPLDDNGATIEERQPPAFETAHVDLPASTETTGPAPSSATPPAAAPVAGSATPAREAAASAPAAVAGTTEAPVAAAAGATAAEAVAEAIAEKMAEFTFHDPDLDMDIPISVPERFAESAKKGYTRRTTYDKSVSYLKNAEPVLREMIEDGRIQRLMPFLQRAIQDPEFAQAVSDVYTRRVAGQPMLEAAVREIQAAPPAGAPATEAYVDPFVDPQVAELRTQTAELLAWRRAQEEQQRTTQQTQAQRDEQQRRNNGLLAAGHRDLANAYPGIFKPELGERDPAFIAAMDYARRAEYTNNYDLRAALVFGGQGWRQIEAERAAATGSTAASALAAVDTRLVEAASREARNAASTVAGGAIATTTAVQPPPLPKTTMPDGSLNVNYMRDKIAWEQQYGRLKGA